MRTSLSSPILLNPDEEITFFDDIQSEAYVSHRQTSVDSDSVFLSSLEV